MTSLKSVSIGTKRASRQGTELQNKTPWWQVAPIKKEDLNKEEVDGPDKADENTEVREYCSSEDLLSRMQHLYKTERIRSADGARMALTKMAELIRQGGPLHAGLHDLLLVFANTKRFFEQVEFKAFKPVLNDVSCLPCVIISVICVFFMGINDMAAGVLWTALQKFFPVGIDELLVQIQRRCG